MGPLAIAVLALAQAGDVRALWRCEPAEIALGEPFALVLELSHPASLAGHALATGTLALDPSWIVLEEAPLESTTEPDGSMRTRRAWRVASLEPGARELGEALSKVVLSEHVTRIQVGQAHVAVSGILGADEDAPRPLREFPDDFAGADARAARGNSWLLLAAGALALGAGGLAWWWRRRARSAVVRVPSALERLAELERGVADGRGNEGCYELTRLLRAAGDGLRRKQRDGLTDEEWLAEVTAALDVPRNAVSEVAAVFERTGRVKYGGEAPTPWSLQETFQRARAALEILGAGTASGGGTRS